MDKRINYKIVLDTETCPLDITSEEVDPYNMFAYDIGWAVVDKRGNVYKTHSYIIADIFFHEKTLMKSAYYYNKIPFYLADISNGKREVKNFLTIWKLFKNDCKEYNVTEVYAHNMRFDLGVLNNTIRWISKSKYRYFFDYNIRICDTLKMSRDIMKHKPTYKLFCNENGYLTANNQPRMTAEVLYRYITHNKDFVEEHTALEDVLIEKDILSYLYRQHKPMRKDLYEKEKPKPKKQTLVESLMERYEKIIAESD